MQSLGNRLTGKGYDSFLVKSAQDFDICQVPAYNLYGGGRPSIMIGRSVGVIFTILADNQREICVTQPCQLIGFFHEIGFPSGELLRLSFCCI